MKLFTDGGARGNPGPAAVGICIKDKNNNVVTTLGAYLGEQTNNEAEYNGLVLGLKTALDMKIPQLECFLDSELVVKQLNGDYKVKNDRLLMLFTKVKQLELKFDSVTYNHVPRKKNKEADKMVNQVLDLVLE